METPTLKEVKKYFKNAEIVESCYGAKFKGVNNIKLFLEKEFFCTDNNGKDYCIYRQGQYARIILYKEELKTDKVVDDVINQFKERSKRGIEKYGTTLQANNTDDFLQHFKEELMDAILYIQKLQSQKNGN